MKKIIFTFLFLLAPFYSAFCQTGYYYNNQFIELIPDESQGTTIVYSNAANQFVSKSYRTKDAEGIKVLPKIILEIKDSIYIQNIRSRT